SDLDSHQERLPVRAVLENHAGIVARNLDLSRVLPHLHVEIHAFMEGGTNENLAKAQAHRQANAHCDKVAGGAPEFAWSWHRRVNTGFNRWICKSVSESVSAAARRARAAGAHAATSRPPALRRARRR